MRKLSILVSALLLLLAAAPANVGDEDISPKRAKKSNVTELAQGTLHLDGQWHEPGAAPVHEILILSG
jgi:hypothetical protein